MITSTAVTLIHSTLTFCHFNSTPLSPPVTSTPLHSTPTCSTIDAALSVFERIGRKGPGFRVDFVAHDPADAARQPEDPAGHFLWVGQVRE